MQARLVGRDLARVDQFLDVGVVMGQADEPPLVQKVDA